MSAAVIDAEDELVGAGPLQSAVVEAAALPAVALVGAAGKCVGVVEILAIRGGTP